MEIIQKNKYITTKVKYFPTDIPYHQGLIDHNFGNTILYDCNSDFHKFSSLKNKTIINSGQKLLQSYTFLFLQH